MRGGQKNNSFINSGLTRRRYLARPLASLSVGRSFPATDSNSQGDVHEHSNFLKLAALAVALMMNSILFGGVAYLFDTQAPPAFAADMRW